MMKLESCPLYSCIFDIGSLVGWNLHDMQNQGGINQQLYSSISVLNQDLAPSEAGKCSVTNTFRFTRQTHA